MMKEYTHITQMESIMDAHSEKLEQLKELLHYLEDNMDDFTKLVAYYYSDQRDADLEADNKGLLDANLKRGVLSEDAIYDVISDYYDCCIKMLELSTAYLKHT